MVQTAFTPAELGRKVPQPGCEMLKMAAAWQPVAWCEVDACPPSKGSPRGPSLGRSPLLEVGSLRGCRAFLPAAMSPSGAVRPPSQPPCCPHGCQASLTAAMLPSGLPGLPHSHHVTFTATTSPSGLPGLPHSRHVALRTAALMRGCGAALASRPENVGRGWGPHGWQGGGGEFLGGGRAPVPLGLRWGESCGGPAPPHSRALPKSLRAKPKGPEAEASGIPRCSEDSRAPPAWAGIPPPSPSEVYRTPSRPRSPERAEVSRARGSREVPG